MSSTYSRLASYQFMPQVNPSDIRVVGTAPANGRFPGEIVILSGMTKSGKETSSGYIWDDLCSVWRVITGGAGSDGIYRGSVSSNSGTVSIVGDYQDCLSILNINIDDYARYLNHDPQLSGLSDVMFIVSGDYINAFNQYISNLNMPGELSVFPGVAATDTYVKNQISGGISSINVSEVGTEGAVITSVWQTNGLVSAATEKILEVDNLTETYHSLSVQKISRSDYEQKVYEQATTGTTSLGQNTLYVIDSDYEDVYGAKILHLSTDGVDGVSDAANTSYVNMMCDGGVTGALSTALSGMKLDPVLSDFNDSHGINGVQLSTCVSALLFICHRFGAF